MRLVTLTLLVAICVVGVSSASAQVPTVVYSDILTSSTSAMPGMPGVSFGTSTFYHLVRSPSANYWLLNAYTDGPSAENEVYILGSGMSGNVIVREGTLAPFDLAGRLYQGLDSWSGVDDQGRVGFSGDVDGPIYTDDDFVALYDGGTVTAIAVEEGDASAVLGLGATWDSLDSAQLSGAGVGFRATLIDGLPGGTANDAAIILGGTVLAQEGITVPTGQAGGAVEPWGTFDLYDFRTDATGNNYAIQGDLAGATTSDDVVVVNGAVVVQEGSFVDPSFANPVDVSGIVGVQMMSNGDWFVDGNNDISELDWVIRNGQLVAATDRPIFPGSSENYDDAPYSNTFFMMIGNNNGDYIIGGVTDNPDTTLNGVLVLNGEQVILREGAGVDLDGNGLLDDNVFINTFRDDDAFLTDDGVLYALVSLKDDTGASAGQALITFVIPEPGTLALLGLGGFLFLRRRR